MNIQQAKQEIIHTLQAYHQKDASGAYLFPRVRQRPILLMGPPGIGKTAIMEQIAAECGTGLVAYTITHHTRQSAIGLPHIEEKIYGGQRMSVTEYTMSEIIASVYECMERTGKQEGILFIDEINCVSETLTPIMLQFLQNKTFGTHKVPDGWMIVAAGNPPEYNKSAREFDIVTLDRVRRIDVEADCEVWMEYAWQKGVHPSILSYLSIHPERFYSVENTADSCSFVTARGWEDLSEILKSYHDLSVSVTEDLIRQYLQKEEISRDFFACFQLYETYGTDYQIGQLLDGTLSPEEQKEKISMAQKGDFDERFMVVTLLLAGLHQKFFCFDREDKQRIVLHETLKFLKNFLKSEGTLSDFIKQQEESLRVKIQAELISPEKKELAAQSIRRLQDYLLKVKKAHLKDDAESFPFLKKVFQEELKARPEQIKNIRSCLDRSFRFIEEAFGDGQEMVLFVSSLSRNEYAFRFISVHGCERYMHYSQKILYKKIEKKLQEEYKSIMAEDPGAGS